MNMNDVRKWLGGVMDEYCNEDLDYGRQEVATELLNLIGRDAEPDPWEAVADMLAERIRYMDERWDIDSAGTLAAYREMKSRQPRRT